MQYTRIITPSGQPIFIPSQYDPIKDAPRAKRTVGEPRWMRPGTPRVTETTETGTVDTYV